MKKNLLVAPVVKWVGGKRQLLDEITPLLPKKITNYCEPFLGGGAVLFSIQPSKATVNDLNDDLINVYRVIRDNVDALIEDLSRYENTEKYYYEVRDLDRNKKIYAGLGSVQRASRLLYLNKTCYNGLFRVNSAGEFNSPFGHYRNPNIVNAPTLRAVSRYFNQATITFCSQDFEEILDAVPRGSFVYLDPPYDPISNSANFTGYQKGGFDRKEQLRLKECCDRLTHRQIKFMLSNSHTQYIEDLYTGYDITVVQAKRAINSVASKRGAVEEVLVRNYAD